MLAQLDARATSPYVFKLAEQSCKFPTSRSMLSSDEESPAQIYMWLELDNLRPTELNVLMRKRVPWVPGMPSDFDSMQLGWRKQRFRTALLQVPQEDVRHVPGVTFQICAGFCSTSQSLQAGWLVMSPSDIVQRVWEIPRGATLH